MRKAGWLMIAALVCACDDDDDELQIVDTDGDGIPDIDDQDDMTPANVIEWRATIVGTGQYSQLSANGIVRQTVGVQLFTAEVTVRGDVANAVRPWHVHFDTCGTGGGIVGEDRAYPRLMTGSDGMATSTVRIPVALDPAASYHINIHESDAAFNNIIACGDLVLQ